MRGKVACMRGDRQRFGITPAYAGKRPTDPFQDIIAKDHPRLCGEKRPRKAGLILLRGSPPPMRGKVRNHCLK